MERCRALLLAFACTVFLLTGNESNAASFKDCNDQVGHSLETLIEACTKIIDAKPKGYRLTVAYGIRASAWQDRGNLELAIADYLASIRADPKNAVAHNNLALIWRDKGELDRALASFENAI